MKITIVKALSLALAMASSCVSAKTPDRPSAPPREVSIDQIDDVGKLLGIVNQLQMENDWENAVLVWKRLTQLRPHRGDYYYAEAAMYALQEEKALAYNALLQLQRKGYGYPLETDRRFEKIHGTEVWDYLVELNKAALSPFGDGEIAFELAPADLLIESIAYDPSRDTFLFGSARDGRIYRRNRDGKLEAWIEPGEGQWAILALAVDDKRNALWATTSAIPHFKGFKSDDSGQAALLKFDLKTGRRLGRYPAPDDGMPHLLTVMALAGNGHVYVGEGLRGQLFKFEGDGLKPMMAERRIGGIRGLALLNDKTLYFADAELGLFGLDLSKGMAFDVGYPDNVALGGIEGLYAYEGQLVAVQNAMRPKRVIRLKLSEDGRKIEQGTPIEASQPAFGTPTWGTIKGEDLYFIANSQRDHYDGYGIAKSSAGTEPVRIFRTPIRFNWDFKPPSLPPSLDPTSGLRAPEKKDGG